MTGDDRRRAPAPRGSLAPWRERPGSAGVLTDFDGTLSPIVDEPQQARPLPGTAATLARLAERHPVVAVISGRPVAYLLDVLGPLPGVTLVGLYGLEHLVAGEVQTLPEADQWRPTVAQVAAAATDEAPPGVYVEPKGLSVGIHYRQAPASGAWVTQWAAAAAARTGLWLRHGKMAVELVPPIAMDKGSVVARLAQGLGAVCYLGDDLGDLPAFEALARLATTGVSAVSVAVRGAESPPELLARADLVVDGPEGALALLQQLARG